MATRKLSREEKNYNALIKLIKHNTYSAKDFDDAKKLCRDFFKVKHFDNLQSPIAHFYFLQTSEFEEPITQQLRTGDAIVLQKCTQEFFNLPFDTSNDGRFILSVLADSKYCSCFNDETKKEWQKFLDYYHCAAQTIQYVKGNIPSSTWKKFSTQRKERKIEIIRKKLNKNFDQYNYLTSYGLNQLAKALIDKLDALNLPNLNKDNMYKITLKNQIAPYLNISETDNETDNEKNHATTTTKLFQKRFIKFFLQNKS